jgi:Protein of Unknown function (DUF2784)
MELVAVLIVAVHLTWIVLVVFGAFWTRGRPVWSVLHVLSLLWGIVAEVGPWPCPLTLAEAHFERGTAAGTELARSGFLLHMLNGIVYPNVPVWMLVSFGVGVCAVNLVIYGWRFWKWWMGWQAE